MPGRPGQSPSSWPPNPSSLLPAPGQHPCPRRVRPFTPGLPNSLTLSSFLLPPLLNSFPCAPQDSSQKSPLGSPLDLQVGSLSSPGQCFTHCAAMSVWSLSSSSRLRWPDGVRTAPPRAPGCCSDARSSPGHTWDIAGAVSRISVSHKKALGYIKAWGNSCSCLMSSPGLIHSCFHSANTRESLFLLTIPHPRAGPKLGVWA